MKAWKVAGMMEGARGGVVEIDPDSRTSPTSMGHDILEGYIVV